MTSEEDPEILDASNTLGSSDAHTTAAYVLAPTDTAGQTSVFSVKTEATATLSPVSSTSGALTLEVESTTKISPVQGLPSVLSGEKQPFTFTSGGVFSVPSVPSMPDVVSEDSIAEGSYNYNPF